jgi:CRISPR-associated endonuclease Cas2
MTHPEGSGLLVSFDVSNDAHRRQLAKTLERFGPRVLRSVYDQTLPPGTVNRLVERINEIVRPSDHAVLVPYCPHAVTTGAAPPSIPFPTEPGWCDDHRCTHPRGAGNP